MTSARTILRRAEAAAQWSASQLRGPMTHGLAALRAFERGAAELVYPRTCASCGSDEIEFAAVEVPPFCSACYGEFEMLHEPTCSRCGGPLPQRQGPGDTHASHGCARCRGRKLWFDATIAAGLYEGRLRELLLRMKHASGDYLSLALGRLLWHECRARLAALRPDVVVPIPAHWRRRWEHGTNSAAVLAETLSGRLRAPLAERLLCRRRHTPPQSGLTPPQRWENMRRAFSVRAGYHLRKAHVLLVDDILTTGATCSEAARTLRRAGADRVTVAVVARAIG